MQKPHAVRAFFSALGLRAGKGETSDLDLRTLTSAKFRIVLHHSVVHFLFSVFLRFVFYL